MVPMISATRMDDSPGDLLGVIFNGVQLNLIHRLRDLLATDPDCVHSDNVIDDYSPRPIAFVNEPAMWRILDSGEFDILAVMYLKHSPHKFFMRSRMHAQALVDMLRSHIELTLLHKELPSTFPYNHNGRLAFVMHTDHIPFKFSEEHRFSENEPDYYGCTTIAAVSSEDEMALAMLDPLSYRVIYLDGPLVSDIKFTPPDWFVKKHGETGHLFTSTISK